MSVYSDMMRSRTHTERNNDKFEARIERQQPDDQNRQKDEVGNTDARVRSRPPRRASPLRHTRSRLTPDPSFTPTTTRRSPLLTFDCAYVDVLFSSRLCGVVGVAEGHPPFLGSCWANAATGSVMNTGTPVISSSCTVSPSPCDECSACGVCAFPISAFSLRVWRGGGTRC